VLEPLSLPFVQRGMLEVLLLALAAGLAGTWVVLRGLAFYAHAVGTATFPGLVLAAGLGFAAPLGAAGAALAFALAMGALAARRRPGTDSLTALVLVGALALGVILANDVFASGGDVETLLFGSLLLIDPVDLAVAAGASALALAATALLGPRWVAAGFEPSVARQAGLRTGGLDLALLVLVAVAAVACLAAVGALLATALLVVPAATARLWTRTLLAWRAATVALVAAEGLTGLWLSVRTDAPPGATVAVLAGAVFALAAAGRHVWPQARRRALPALALLPIAVLLGGWGGGNDRPGVHVVATTTQIADLVRNVGGDALDVHAIIPANADPHEFEPRPGDVRATADARVVFVNGQRLDAWMGKVVERSGAAPRVIDLGATLPERLPGERTGQEASRYDPHWWNDPANVAAAVLRIRAALSAADPAERGRFAANARAYLAALGVLDAGTRRCVATVPPADRKLVTDHDAFGYFARRYGLRVVGAVIPSQTTQGQASGGELAALRGLVRREGVRAVFPERSLPARTARAVARETGASARYELYGDSLGPAGSRGATYLGMEEANADAIVRGLTGGRRGCDIGGIP
jgi:ABC-type Zn uptake system ZnuABC Zn-binding protein ZnuA/ABC-type Mn2+/Zn2+ transport system permease subunit